jgi:hypothetical protein
MLVDKDRTPSDPTRVSLTEEWEVRYWCDKFGCSEVALRNAVQDAGTRVEDVARRLGKDAKEVFKHTGED